MIRLSLSWNIKIFNFNWFQIENRTNSCVINLIKWLLYKLNYYNY